MKQKQPLWTPEQAAYLDSRDFEESVNIPSGNWQVWRHSKYENVLCFLEKESKRRMMIIFEKEGHKVQIQPL